MASFHAPLTITKISESGHYKNDLTLKLALISIKKYLEINMIDLDLST